MTILEAYKKFQLKVNKQDSGDNIDISPGEFILIFNEQQIKWFETKFKGVTGRLVDEVQSLLQPDFKLVLDSKNTGYNSYKLPDDFFDYVNGYSSATCTNCNTRTLIHNHVRVDNINEYLKDEHNKPSFAFHETLITISNKKINVYIEDFEIISSYMSYYRYPKEVDIVGYLRLDGNQSTNIDPELTVQNTNEVIDMCVLEVQRNIENGDGFQLSKDRIK